MRKMVPRISTAIFILLFVCKGIFANAQDNLTLKSNALALIHQNAVKLGLSENDELNYRISDVYVDRLSGAMIVYLQQTYKGVDVYNTMQVAAFKNNNLFSSTGSRIPRMGSLVNSSEGKVAVQSADAVKAAAAHLGLTITEPVITSSEKQVGEKLSFGNLGISKNNVTAKRLWIPAKDGKVQLAWQVEISPNKSSDYWLVKVDALTGTILGKDNLTVSCGWSKPGNVVNEFYAASINQNAVEALPAQSFAPDGVTSASYTVVPFPAEAPSFPGGTPSSQLDPWNLAGTGNDATTLKWNYDGTNYFDSTRGNNVWSGTDTDANDKTDMTAHSLTAEPTLSFDFVPDFAKQPSTPNNRNVAMTNLFYWNNIMHDISYQYGFDEVSGNFQKNNQGRGGLAGDFVYADAQDGSGTDNANFSTPADGSNPRMQMFLFGGNSLTVNSPPAIAGSVNSEEGAVSTKNLLANIGAVTADVIMYNDDALGLGHGACVAAANKAALKGKIALIFRGNCAFAVKIKNAQNAGAVGVIMVDSVTNGNLVIMSGSDNTITIPAVFISKINGARIKTQLTAGTVVNATLAKLNLDGDLDASVMCHEYTHGISNRLTGGPSVATCLQNVEQMGEGWSDYDAIMITTNWATATINDGSKPHPMGTYVLGESPIQGGIRRYPYSIEQDFDPWTYDSLPATAGEPHYIGEIWCTVLWDMTWGIIQKDGINPNLFDATAAGGNTVAMKLVYEGMKLQKCSPGFIDGRDGILKADTLLYGGKYSCAIWTAFAKRGMGASASEGSSNSVTDQKTDYKVPANACKGLPVTWGTFTAIKSGNNALLNWSTLQETNSSKYIIQRSNDGLHFETIGTVAAAGISSVTAKYNFTDGRPLNGTDYYRLQQVDKNGNYVYSETRTLSFSLPRTIIISPNPAKDVLNVTVTGNTDALKLYLVNSQGQNVQQYNMSSQDMQITLPKVSGGVYYLKIASPDGSVSIHKVVIQ